MRDQAKHKAEPVGDREGEAARDAQRLLTEVENALGRLERLADELQGRRRSAGEADLRAIDLRLEALGARIELQSSELKSQAEKLERRLEAVEATAVRSRAVAESIWQSKPWRIYLKLGALGRRLAARFRSLREMPARRRRRTLLERSLIERIRAAGVVFDGGHEPAVSVILPVRHGVEKTVRCLESIGRIPDSTPHEVIVVDDGSSDGTHSVLSSVPGLEVVRLRPSRGFARAANAGAEVARGRYLVFLRGGTEVTKGWLDELHRTFLERPEAGLVGSKLLASDGRLREAGGLVWRDASCSSVGRGGDPVDPQFNYLREVDYATSASLMIRRELFEALGGFDGTLPDSDDADVDLAFKVRASGNKVLFQPLSEAIWHEADPAEAEIGRDRSELRERWSDALAAHRPPGESELLERERSIARRVLVIDHRVPAPDQDSGSLRMVNLLEVLRGLGVKVTFMPHDLIPLQPYTDDLRRSGVEMSCWPPTVSIEAHLKRFGHNYDAVVLSRLHVAWPSIDSVRRHCPRAVVVFDTVDLQFLRRRRFGELGGDRHALEEARLIEARELDLIRRADLTLVVSPVEKELLAELLPGARVEIVSNVHKIHRCRRAFEERKHIFFIGGFEHRPNVDGVQWLVREIFPHIRELLPGVRLYLIGSKPPDEVLALATDDVEVLGYVADLEPYLGGCRLSIAPLRYGAGVKGKVNQSMAWGLPCVATSMAVEGMELRDGEQVLVADDPRHFAECVRRAYTDPELWHRLSESGIENIRRHFSFEAAETALFRALPFLRSEAESNGSSGVSLESKGRQAPESTGLDGE